MIAQTDCNHVDIEIHDYQELSLMRSQEVNLDKIEERIYKMSLTSPMLDKVTHRFTPGLYIREIFMPAGSLVTSKIHKTTHPYVISKGRVSVWSECKGLQRLQAPYTGITEPGTRRLIFVHEDCIWTTFHPTDLTDLKKIEDAIIEPHNNPFLLNEEQMKEFTR